VAATVSGGDGDQAAAVVAAWSLVHGFATLWLAGNIPTSTTPPEQFVRQLLDVVDVRR
jgi:hypothetical protein